LWRAIATGRGTRWTERETACDGFCHGSAWPFHAPTVGARNPERL